MSTIFSEVNQPYLPLTIKNSVSNNKDYVLQRTAWSPYSEKSYLHANSTESDYGYVVKAKSKDFHSRFFGLIKIKIFEPIAEIRSNRKTSHNNCYIIRLFNPDYEEEIFEWIAQYEEQVILWNQYLREVGLSINQSCPHPQEVIVLRTYKAKTKNKLEDPEISEEEMANQEQQELSQTLIQA